MRRTFQDMARAAEVEDMVTRAVSGHAIESMQQHHSTVAPAEIREAIEKVISLAGIMQAVSVAGKDANQGGVQGHVPNQSDPQKKKKPRFYRGFCGAGEET